MTLDELRILDLSALWTSLPAAEQAEIGTAAIRQELARLVAADAEAGRPAQMAAVVLASEANADLAHAVEAALPGIDWWPT